MPLHPKGKRVKMIFRHPELGIVTVYRHRRYRRISLRPQDIGRAALYVPQEFCDKDVRRFFKEHKKAITALCDKQRRIYDETAQKYNYNPHMSQDQAIAYLGKRLSYWANKITFDDVPVVNKVTRVTIRNQRSRWGSCSHRGHISLNIMLMRLPEELRDYVLIHELVHLQEPNHGALFWKYMETLIPNVGELKKAVRNIQPLALKEFR